MYFQNVTFRRFVVDLGCVSLLAFGLVGISSRQADTAKADDKPVVAAATAPSALRIAKAQGSRVLVEDETTQVALTYANPDGSFSQEISASPERVFVDGKWQDINPMLKQAGSVYQPTVAGNTVQVARGAAKSAAVASLATSPRVLSSAALSLSGKRVTGSYVVGAGKVDSSPTLSLVWPKKLAAPKVAGNKAVFTNAHTLGDLVVSVSETSFARSLILRKRPAVIPPVKPGASLAEQKKALVKAKKLAKKPVKIRIPFTAKGFKLVKASGSLGAVEIRDAKNRMVGGFSSPLVKSPKQGAKGKEPLVSAPVAVKVLGTAAKPVVEWSIAGKFIRDTRVPFPLEVGASGYIAASGATYVEKGKTASGGSMNDMNFNGDSELKVGTYDSGSHVARSYIQFSSSSFTGTQVTKAALLVWENWSASCAAKKLSVNRVKATWSASKVTWNNKPSYDTSAAGSANKSLGWSSSCKEGYLPNENGIPITTLAQAWANGTTNYGVALTASTSDSLGWKRFWSDNVSAVSKRPRLLVTFFKKPNTPTKPTVSPSSTIINTTTPTLSTTVSTPDGAAAGKVTATFTVKSSIGATFTMAAPAVASGSVAKVVVPSGKLVNAGKYTVTATASVKPAGGSTITSATSPVSNAFTVDVVTPATPHIAASEYTPGGTFDPAPTDNVFTFSPGSSRDVAKYEYQQDGGAIKTVTACGGQATLPWSPELGSHVLKVWALDAAGNRSAPARYGFTVGSIGFTVPGIQARSSRIFPVEATKPGAANKATVSWSADGTNFHQINTGLFIQRDGATDEPWDGTGLRNNGGSAMLPAGLIWDIDKTQEADPVAEENLIAPNIIRLRACFQQDAAPITCTSGDKDVPIQYVHHAFGGNFAEADIPGGTVALQTGELRVEETDTSLPGSGDISVGRAWMSLMGDIDDEDAIFGPGWEPAVPAPDAGAGDAQVIYRSNLGSIMLNYPGGDTDVFVHKTKGGTGNGTYAGSGITAESGSYLTLSGNSLELTDPDGTTTKWSKQGDSWINPVITETGTQGLTRILSSPTTRVAITGRFENDGTLGWCSNLSSSPTVVALTKQGCRVMTVNIAPDSTPTPTGDNVGDFPKRANNVEITLWNPATSQMETTIVSKYEYNSDGLLVSAWDPRMDGDHGSLKARYKYDKVGVDHRLIEATPESALVDGNPALTPISFGYDGIKRTTLSRRNDPSLDQQASTFVVYGVPLHKGDVLPDLRPEAVEKWNQGIDGAPGSAAAVFSPDPNHDLPDNTDVYTPDDEDWQYAALSYMNDLGATTNKAAKGAGQWLVDTIQYNEEGEVVATLDAADRALALDEQCEAAPGVCAQDTSAAKAALLQSDTIYDPKQPGVVTDTYSPAVQTQLPNGSMGTTRVHTKTQYNQGAPSGFVDDNPGTMLPTTATATTLIVDGPGAGTEVAPRVTNTAYDTSPAGGYSGWTLRQATQTSTQTGTGLTIRQRTAYDSDGNVTKSLQPDSNGNDAGTTIKVAYSAEGNPDYPECGGKSAWEGSPCISTPAGQPSGAGIPVSFVESYNQWLEPTEAKDRTPSGSVLRTTTNTYDAASRVVTTKTDSTVGDDTNIPLTTTTYSQTIGSSIKVSAAGKDLLTGYDSWGRPVKTTDATGNEATTQYDIASNPSETNDGKGTFEYTYDYGDDNQERGEHRGVLTQIDTDLDDDTNGELNAEYGTQASPTLLTYPNGVQANMDYDAVGQLQSKEYLTRENVSIAHWTQIWSAYGQVLTENADHRTQKFSYDNTGRLLQSVDTRSGKCQARNYAFNGNSDRLSRTATTPTDGNCVTGVTTKTDNSFNAADQQTSTRLTTTVDDHSDTVTGSYTYDQLGHTTVLPAVDSPNNTATSFTYFADDQVASQKQGNTVMSWTRDPAGRALSWSTTGGTGTALPNGTNHYAGDGDSPAWTNSGNTVTQNISGIDGGLALTSTNEEPNAGTFLHLVNPHGDITATMKNVPNATPADIKSENETDEYGNPLTANPPVTYGWEGSAQRSRNTLPALTLMGVRQYNPVTGRFLSLDPIEGGNANNYTYPVDPVNSEDLSGEFAWAIPLIIVGISFAIAGLFAMQGMGSFRNLSYGISSYVRDTGKSFASLGRSLQRMSFSLAKFNASMSSLNIALRKKKSKARQKPQKSRYFTKGGNRNGTPFKGKAAALAAAKAWASGRGSASLRRKKDSINVDVFNKRRQLVHTEHFWFRN